MKNFCNYFLQNLLLFFQGSIAEREHQKWKNAQNIPNNPYSAEALQKRLSNSGLYKGGVDVSNLTAQMEKNNNDSDDVDATDSDRSSSSGKPLQIVLGAGKPDHMR